MRRTLVCVLLGTMSAALLGACSFLTNLDGLQGDADAAVDATEEGDGSASLDGTADSNVGDAAVDHFGQPDSGFLLSVSPAHITADPGDSFPVDVTLNRAASFSDAVTIAVNGLPTGATATPLVIPGAASAGTFSLGISVSTVVTNADINLTVVASNGMGGFSVTTPLVLRVGSALLPNTGGAYIVPAYATTLIVKAWGGGGGGGGINGAPGGGGGFVSARLPVTPGEALTSDVGTGGTDNGGGAGGGGLTGLRRGSTYVLIAGGGGGGGWSFNYAPQAPDRNGGGGGGLTGQDAPDPQGGGGHGGTQVAGGVGGPDAGSGSSLQGGNALNPNQPGGTPGGGFGGYTGAYSAGGGGGGAGYFGGGGGTDTSTLQGTGGGGGGSGYVILAATMVVLTAANNVNCANASDPDRIIGVGVGGPAGPESKPNGGPGLLVVRLTKP